MFCCQSGLDDSKMSGLAFRIPGMANLIANTRNLKHNHASYAPSANPYIVELSLVTRVLGEVSVSFRAGSGSVDPLHYFENEFDSFPGCKFLQSQNAGQM
jgi:hypothetical protein